MVLYSTRAARLKRSTSSFVGCLPSSVRRATEIFAFKRRFSWMVIPRLSQNPFQNARGEPLSSGCVLKQVGKKRSRGGNSVGFWVSKTTLLVEKLPVARLGVRSLRKRDFTFHHRGIDSETRLSRFGQCALFQQAGTFLRH